MDLQIDIDGVTRTIAVTPHPDGGWWVTVGEGEPQHVTGQAFGDGEWALRIGEDRQPGDKCAAFLDRYDDLLAEHGRAERLDTSIIVNNEERARYFEAVVGNDDPDKTCPLPR